MDVELSWDIISGKVMPKGRVTGFALRHRFMISVVVLAIVVFSLSFSPEVLTGDGSTYILLGKHIAEGRYTQTFFHRMPLIPSMFAAMYAAGFSVTMIRFLIPLAFIILSLVATNLLVRELAGPKKAMISTMLLFAFPQFWRWGIKFLVDIPMLALTAFSVYFFIRGLKERKHFLYMAVPLALGMLTKLTFFLVPPILILYLIIRDRKALVSKEFIAGMLIPVVIFLLVFLTVTSMRSADDFMQIDFLVERSASQEGSTPFKQLMTGTYTDMAHLYKLALFPVLVFAPFGLIGLWKGKRRFSLFFFALLAIMFFFISPVRLRLYSPLYPFLMVFSAEGLAYLTELFGKRHAKRIITAAFFALLLISFIDAMYLVSLDIGMQWGAVTLSEYAATLDGRIASEYMPGFLNVTSDVISDNEWVKATFNDNFTYGMIEEAGADYVIISIYREFGRNPTDDTYHPYLGPIEISMVSRPYTGDRVPPGYTFRSVLFEKIDRDPRLSKVKEISNPSGQTIFLVYGVA